MSFWLLFRSLHFLALVFATISLVCFGVQEKKVRKNSCFCVSWFSNATCKVTFRDSYVLNYCFVCECFLFFFLSTFYFPFLIIVNIYLSTIRFLDLEDIVILIFVNLQPRFAKIKIIFIIVIIITIIIYL